MQLAGIQFNIAWEDPEENFRRVTPMVANAVERGAELVVLPEMFATGFTMDVTKITPRAGDIREFLADTARQHRITLVGGIVEQVPGLKAPRGANLALAFGPNGDLIARYQKIHPFSYGKEHRYYEPGDQLSTFAAGELRVAPFVCYDLRFPEVFRPVACDVHLMVVIANWPDARRMAWRHLLVSRAIENLCFVLGVNVVGELGGLRYSGDSLLAGPLGEILAEGAPGPDVVLGEVHRQEVEQARERFPFLQDRRIELYRRLSPPKT